MATGRAVSSNERLAISDTPPSSSVTRSGLRPTAAPTTSCCASASWSICPAQDSAR